MGDYYAGVPFPVVEFFCNEENIKLFCETGTHRGASAVWASERFAEVFTIELSEASYKKVVGEYGHIPNITFLQGNSAHLLPAIAKRAERCLFWLDAHWSGGTTAGESLPCPLLTEIEAVLSGNEEHVILIDDARQTTVRPLAPAPHELPWMFDIFAALNSRGERYTVIWRDVYISTPLRDAQALYAFLCAQPRFVK